MSAQVVMRQMSVLLMALGLSACVGMTVQPAVSKNYQLTLVNPDRNSRGGVLEDDAADAYAAHLAEKDVLWTSNEPVLLKWRQELDQLKGKSQLEQLRGVNDLVNGSVHYKSDYEHWRRLDRWG
ncbi:MAG: hypothetical protein REI12_03750, partial [Pedobacter sp.]|nr:hypothetical protein [Pedobacter sp.]